jgi:hypothetical protein
MSDNDLQSTRQEIERLKQQIEISEPGEKRRLLQRLLELQKLQLWWIGQAENQQRDRKIDEIIAAEFDAVRAEHNDIMQATQDRADRIRAYMDAGDLGGLRKCIDSEKAQFEDNIEFMALELEGDREHSC